MVLYVVKRIARSPTWAKPNKFKSQSKSTPKAKYQRGTEFRCLHIKETVQSFNIKDATILDKEEQWHRSWHKGSDLGTSGGAITKQKEDSVTTFLMHGTGRLSWSLARLSHDHSSGSVAWRNVVGTTRNVASCSKSKFQYLTYIQLHIVISTSINQHFFDLLPEFFPLDYKDMDEWPPT